jgi:uncharacterized protein YhhL (DUF1145 family)
MISRRRHLIAIAAGYLAGIAAYAWLPAGPSFAGNPHFWTSPIARPFLAFLLPTTAALIYVLIRRVWARDLVRDREEPFEPTYDSILFTVVAFVIAIHLMVLATLTGALPAWRTSLVRATIILFGLVVARVGNLLPRTRPNLAFGFRTAHTLADRRLWMQIHRTAGYVAVGMGLVFVIGGAFLTKQAMGPVTGIATATALIVFVISFYRYSSVSERTEP